MFVWDYIKNLEIKVFKENQGKLLVIFKMLFSTDERR